MQTFKMEDFNVLKMSNSYYYYSKVNIDIYFKMC